MYIKSFKKILEEEDIDDILDYYDIYLEEEKDKEEAIINYITRSFEDFLDSEYGLEVRHIMDEIIKEGYCESYIENIMLDDGFLYFDDDDNKIVPQELYDIVKERFTKDKQLELLKHVLSFYLIINDSITKKFISKNYIDRCKLDITIEDLSNMDGVYTKKDYFVCNDNYDLESLKKAIRTKGDYIYLCPDDILDYYDTLDELCKDVKELVKDETEDIRYITEFLTASPIDKPEEFYKVSLKECGLSKYTKGVIELYYKYVNDIRFKLYKGRKLNDIFLDMAIEHAKEIKNFEEYTVNDCEFKDFVGYSKTKIKEDINNADYLEIAQLFSMLESAVNYESFDINLFHKYYMGVVKKNGEYYYAIPYEIKELIDEKNNVVNDVKKKLGNDYFNLISYVEIYIDYNGILTYDKLIELLEEKKIKISKDILKKYISYANYKVKDEYIMDERIEEEDIEEIIKKKRLFTNYKIDFENRFWLWDTLSSLLDDYEIEDEYLIDDLNYYIKLDKLTRKMFNDVLNFHDVVLSNKEMCDLYNKIKKLINDAPLWVYNGYSKKELE